jgi:hypothetical protein
MTSHDLFGIFLINPYHNIVHIGIGAFWLLGAFALTPAGNEGLDIAIGGVYALATVIAGWATCPCCLFRPGPSETSGCTW